MQLDRTRIAIRERDGAEILDLSLHVVGTYAGPLLLTMALGMVPMMIVNQLLIGWMADVEYREEFPTRYVWNMLMLVFLEAPLAGAFASYFLGQAVFLDRPQLGTVLRDVCRTWPQLAWCQLLVRGVLPAWLLLLAVDRQAGFDGLVEGFLLPLLVLYAAGLRAIRPFMNEIVLLERNPLRSRDPNQMTISRRSRLLHSPSGGDLISRALGMAFVALLLFFAVYGGFLFISGVFLNDWEPGPLLIQLFLPISLWIVAAYMNVVRFLNYLDVRIRHEGWEVELRLRAESVRLINSLRSGLS